MAVLSPNTKLLVILDRYVFGLCKTHHSFIWDPHHYLELMETRSWEQTEPLESEVITLSCKSLKIAQNIVS